ncbi:trimeric intracellular cation channel family protein [Gulosibacter hominis]|uniref:trimeric intracellular cation channel family protein n=1 Tax=Gulosibacter hominis TaxID=2770504 RepID=UPI001917D96A|nr:TRIC cation channel family protein [Gulosibacter hominis]
MEPHLVQELPTIPLWLDLTAVAFGALSASATAEGVQRQGRRIDWLGVAILGVSVGLGGGFMRDLLLGVPPATIQNNWYVLTAALAALCGMWLSYALNRINVAVTILDAMSLGVFAVVGTSKAIGYGVEPLPAIMIGTVAAAGGGAVRDLLLQVPVGVLYAGTFYAAAAFFGAASYVALDLLGVGSITGMIVCFTVTVAIRMASVWWGLSLPEQMALRLPQRLREPNRERLLRRRHKRGSKPTTRPIPITESTRKRKRRRRASD